MVSSLTRSGDVAIDTANEIEVVGPQQNVVHRKRKIIASADVGRKPPKVVHFENNATRVEEVLVTLEYWNWVNIGMIVG